MRLLDVTTARVVDREVVPAQSTNSFSPALCSWRSTTSCLRRQRWYSSQKRE
jgi:hypothetical protein